MLDHAYASRRQLIDGTPADQSALYLAHKRELAKRWLGDKWLLHSANRVSRLPRKSPPTKGRE